MTDTVIEVNGKLVDLNKCVPLNMGQLKKLQAAGVDATKVGSTDFIAQATYLRVVLERGNSEITDEDVDSLEATPFADIVTKVGELATAKSGLDRPLETGSTS